MPCVATELNLTNVFAVVDLHVCAFEVLGCDCVQFTLILAILLRWASFGGKLDPLLSGSGAMIVLGSGMRIGSHVISRGKGNGFVSQPVLGCDK